MILFEVVSKFQLHKDISTNLLLNFSMFQFLSIYEINLKFGNTYVDYMLKVHENQRPVTCCPRTLNVTSPNSEKCKTSMHCWLLLTIQFMN